MAPKKKQQQKQKGASSSSSKNKSQSSTGPKLQISAENEQRLRRLLLNSGRPSSSPSVTPANDTISKAQKAKKLRSIYEKLSCEGFTADQIEQALSALNEGATFEAALDWLCLNLPGNELPLKFSSGTSMYTSEGGSVSIISAAREDWIPSQNLSTKNEDKMPEVSVRIKGKWEDDTFDSRQSSQADWIRKYVEQQEEEEDEWETVADNVGNRSPNKEASDPSSRAVSIAKEYHIARLQAVTAKEKGDKKIQEEAGHKIRELKQEMHALGLSEDILAEYGDEHASDSILSSPMACKGTDTVALSESVLHENEQTVDGNLCVPVQKKANMEGEEPGDVELDNLFSEDSSGTLPPEVLKLQKKENMAGLSSAQVSEKFAGIWKKGEPQKIPKAVLHQICQRLGWEAPKFNKVLSKGNRFSYSVNVLRRASGRGKSRKAGGLLTLHLPDQEEAFESAEDAQNRVAAFALYRLFPDFPVHRLITEPYSSFIKKLLEGESLAKIEDTEDIRRADFVDSLLNSGNSESNTSVDFMNDALDENLVIPDIQESLYSAASAKPERKNNRKEVESAYLRQELENKGKVQKYREMLGFRAALPIAELKGNILQLLEENDVLVVCGETGCGKTTQVPQFILDDMIEAGLGGYCNIICTQPRRIAAISVAERVADERCEPSPGSNGSLVGFQVRLDTARNERTKLLFCTTGILLRKLAGDKNLTGVTHVIVDEVHERSLLSDFLLIVLKNLIEKQSTHQGPKLKVILMSATVDSSLFSRYFGNCPVVTAQGRTHPVSTLFLEDIYENLNYALASDSPASLKCFTSTKGKFRSSTVGNHRGKKNLVLSSWGDDSLLSENYVNPYYVPSSYQSYSERTQKNLKCLNEDVIDYDLLEDLVCHIDETYPAGSILVFLPGVAEIYTLLDKLVASYQFGGLCSEWLLPLHSSLSSTDQRKVFRQPPENIRKVIVATDIAETSITIDDVVYVVDCGKHKESRYNPQKKLSSMVEDWISQANAKQRRGRAGRVKPGICFCLYTCHRIENLMRPFQVPEMLRMPLIELCLQIKSLYLGFIKPFLLKAIDPPREEAITSAITMLYEVGALEGNEELTPLGYHLAKLPVDVLIGKMMLYGAIFGCLSPILSISAFLSYKSPFVYPKDEKQNIERAKISLLTDRLDGTSGSDEGERQSDHLLMVVAYKRWVKILLEKGARAAQNFCNSYFLSSSVMYMIRDMRIQFGNLLADIGLVDLPKISQTDGKVKDKLDNWFSDMSQPFNKYSHHSSVVKSVLCAGLYPNVAATEEGIVGFTLGSTQKPSASTGIKGCPFWYDGRREVQIHPSSINSNIKAFQYPFLVFLEKVETNKVFLRDTSIISPYSILLFGGSINIQHQTGMVVIDGWLKLKAPAQTAVLFKELRLTLHAVLKELIKKPEDLTFGKMIGRAVVDGQTLYVERRDKPSCNSTVEKVHTTLFKL
ncbi:PREDICTED: DExH-box ATP-dependent RNA helicase DExH7, chloroplastic isoform X1 [Nelumbo nucifera]|uniref:RNA helicase n=1 Tax=Nelumbo nucifera TaxID=4432 RepID=A0A1U7ZS60_NELNU|nr:PREDICTED: DExH-box ATP-dependent RNA helicase DExH7, chloroplastic isoform X1 [Nelumbo nucifera]